MANVPDTSNSVILDVGKGNSPTIHEDTAGEDITPSELLTYATDGDLEAVSTAPSIDTNATNAPKVAIVDEGSGKGIDDDYSSGDEVRYFVPQPGEIFKAFLDTGSDSEVNVSKGDTLEPSGTGGNLRIQQGSDTGSGSVVYDNTALFEAEEDLDNSAAGSRSRIKVSRI